MTAALAIGGLVVATVIWGLLFLDDGTRPRSGCGGCGGGSCSGEGKGDGSCRRDEAPKIP